MKEGRQLAKITSKKTTTIKTKAGKDMDVVELVYDRLDVIPHKEVTKKLPIFKLENNEALATQLQTLEEGTEVCLVVDNEKWGEVLAIEDKESAPAPGSKLARSSVRTDSDSSRQNSIIFQNSLAHATALVLHNSTGKVTASDIISEAYNFYDVSRDPEGKRAVVDSNTTEATESLNQTLEGLSTKKFNF
jgi:hypothetical protein